MVVLSRRNILTLLHKLEMENSAQTIIKPGGTVVIVEPDEEHYAGREPGPMHPETEQFVRDVQDALLIVREHRQAGGARWPA